MSRVTVTDKQDFSQYGWPILVEIDGLISCRHQTREMAFDFFFGKYPTVRITNPSLETELRGKIGMNHGADPRCRSKEELDSLPVGTQLTYYGQGDVFTTTKQAHNEWLSDVGWRGLPTMPTSMRN